MVNRFQGGAVSSRLGIPIIYGIDAVHGNSNVYKATIFPHNIGLGATRDPELVKRIGAATALETRATGINYAFAPCIAVCRDPRWGRCYESYSEDVEIVKSMTVIISGLQGDVPSNVTKGIPYVGGKITKKEHSNYTYSVLASINAGIDMVMVPNNYKEFTGTLLSLVKNRFIPMSRIDDAVQRILRVKFTMGLFENPFADYSLVHYLGCQAHRDLAREAVRKSLVLLKNGKDENQPLLPLPKNASRILVAGTHANNLGYQCGGWTLTWQGLSGYTTAGAESEYKAYKDPTRKIGSRIRDLMGRMTLEEKIGQMTQLDRQNLTAAVLRDYSIGSVLSGGGSVPWPNATAAEWVEMVNGFQNASLASRLGIPMIYGIDAVHGHNNVYKATIFPHNVGLGATRYKHHKYLIIICVFKKKIICYWKCL
nr:beta-glucosidase BoGH3B-like [Ipomoea batatas]